MDIDGSTCGTPSFRSPYTVKEALVNSFDLLMFYPNNGQKGKLIQLLHPSSDDRTMVRFGRQLIQAIGRNPQPVFLVGIGALDRIGAELHLERSAELAHISDLVDQVIGGLSLPQQGGLRYLATLFFRANPEYLHHERVGEVPVIRAMIRWDTNAIRLRPRRDLPLMSARKSYAEGRMAYS